MAEQTTFLGADANISNPFAWLCTQPEGLLKLSFTPDVECARLIPTDPFNKKPASERTESARSSRQAAQDKYRSLSLVQLGNGHEREKSHFVVMSLQAPHDVRNALNHDERQWSELVQIMQPIALRSDGHLSESIILEPNPTGSSSNRDVIVYVRDISKNRVPNLWLHNEGWLKLSDVHTHITAALQDCHGLGPLRAGMIIFLLQRKSLPLSKSIGNQQYRFCVTLPTCQEQLHAVSAQPKYRWGFLQACTYNGIALVCNVTGSDWTSVAAKYSCHEPVTYHPNLVWANLVSAFPALGSLSITPPLPRGAGGGSAPPAAAQSHQFHPVTQPGTSLFAIPTSTLPPSMGLAAPPPLAVGPPPNFQTTSSISVLTGAGQAGMQMPPSSLGFISTVPMSDAPSASPHAYSPKRSRGREDSDESENPAAYLEHLPEQFTKRPRSPCLPHASTHMFMHGGPAPSTATDSSGHMITQGAAKFLQLGSQLAATRHQRGEAPVAHLAQLVHQIPVHGMGGPGSPAFGLLADHLPQNYMMGVAQQNFVGGHGSEGEASDDE